MENVKVRIENEVSGGMKYRYRTDEEMKDSGVEWIGKIPKEWSIVKGKYLFKNKKLKNSGGLNNILSLTLNGVIDRDKNNFEGLQPESFDGYQEFNNDNLVFKLIDLENINTSRVGYVHKDGLMSPAYIRLEKNKDIHVKYYYYNYFDYYNQKIYNFLGSVGVRSALNSSDLVEMDVINNKLIEQEKIAKFLDEKTAQFDSIISKKEALIERLEEAKKSLISEVVTGKVKVVKTNEGYELVERKKEEMKDSGVEWLGDIPHVWKVSKIKYNTYVKGRIGWQGLKSDEFIDYGPYLVTGTDFENGKIDWNKCYHISEERYDEAPEIQLKDGDLLITKDGSIGKLAIVKNCPKKSILNSGIFVTRCTNLDYLTEFMYYILSSDIFDKYVDLTSVGSTIQHLYQYTFVNFSYPLPIVTEQKNIVEYLNVKINLIDNLIDSIKEQIKKIKEAKQSLISEAVTGKIEILD